MSIKAKNSLSSLNLEFDSDTECRQALEELRWPNGVTCLRCGSSSISRIRTRRQYDCNQCRYRFSVTTGTVFNDSHLALPKWFIAVFLMCESKKGVSANQIRRTLGVAQKTAWYLCHRIRKAMSEVNATQLTGTVEMDETYLGSKRRTRGIGQGNWRPFKQIVLGAVERNGRLRLSAGIDNKKTSLKGFIAEHISDDAAHVYTDELPAYKGLIADEDTTHETVNHSAREYVRGDVHTNTIEGAFGLFKRGLVGSFHQVSRKHLDRYLDEFEFRYNNRRNPYLFRDTLQKLITAEAMPYEQLTASAHAS
jgi:transposase-like protein